ncbi:efflux RND transporter periplasmic adaptor subunit [Pseudomonas aeruginosa]|uniref:efflux RND transporter periplasmic adaptor subunit n=1 Tax=Pseudomonas aeruginosa TaxID=287 RepID=UPI00294926C4|nr:efflux RND transporter periplasmic adaptor subunit [Pseudomonas mendocina]MDV5861551.1 efflux RND transporter periplasmic adaptor subunit [Pseudomonas mendocina]
MIRLLSLSILCLLVVGCSPQEQQNKEEPKASLASADYERGPNNGRMLREGNFALEVTIFENNAPPQYRLYAYIDGAPLNPQAVNATIRLKRLDGEINDFTFKAEGDYLAGNGEVTEPHSFDVEVTAQHGGSSYQWEFDSYEGRVTIPAAIAKDAGIEVQEAGPATIRDIAKLTGTVAFDTNRYATVRARFPGIVRSVNAQVGEQVKKGQVLATIEGNDSMRAYSVTAPISGIVLSRSTNVGDVAEAGILFELADPSQVWVDLRAIGSDAEELSPGQSVRIKTATSKWEIKGEIKNLLPTAGVAQSVMARIEVPNAEGHLRPGMTVLGEVELSAKDVPLAVKESGLQRFRDFTVVFASIGESYEVRMLELGDRDGEYVEVLGGLKPGTRYVAEQSFLIRQDIEKSGAGHDH